MPKDDAGRGRTLPWGQAPRSRWTSGHVAAAARHEARGGFGQDTTCAPGPRGQHMIILNILLTEWKTNQGLPRRM